MILDSNRHPPPPPPLSNRHPPPPPPLSTLPLLPIREQSRRILGFSITEKYCVLTASFALVVLLGLVLNVRMDPSFDRETDATAYGSAETRATLGDLPAHELEVWFDPTKKDPLNYDKPTPILWQCQRNTTGQGRRPNCSSIETTWYYPPTRPEPDALSMGDRISAIGWKYMAEVTYFGLYEQWERDNFRHPLECYMHCLRPYTIVLVDENVFKKFMSDIYPHIRVPIVLVMTDGDGTKPDTLLVKNVGSDRHNEYKKTIAHIYATNCHPDASRQYPDWVTCVPVGLSQLDDNVYRRRIHAALSLRWGNYGKLLTSADIDNNRIHDAVRARKDAVNSVLVSFSVGSNLEARVPALKYFCDPSKGEASPFHRIGGAMARCNNNFNQVKEGSYMTFHAHLSEYRFAVSPHGAGYDCYRTYEILLMGSYPIVKASQLDMMYQDWPVLIVKEWTDATPQLLNDTYWKFAATTWNLERLYNTYWEQLIYRKRAALGGPKHRLQYFLTD